MVYLLNMKTTILVANPDKSYSSKSDDIANESAINQPGDNIKKIN